MPPTDFATHAETVALFRYGLIADLRDVRPGDRSLHVRLEEKAERDYDIPGHRPADASPSEPFASGSTPIAAAASTR